MTIRKVVRKINLQNYLVWFVVGLTMNGDSPQTAWPTPKEFSDDEKDEIISRYKEQLHQKRAEFEQLRDKCAVCKRHHCTDACGGVGTQAGVWIHHLLRPPTVKKNPDGSVTLDYVNLRAGSIRNTCGLSRQCSNPNVAVYETEIPPVIFLMKNGPHREHVQAMSMHSPSGGMNPFKYVLSTVGAIAKHIRGLGEDKRDIVRGVVKEAIGRIMEDVKAKCMQTLEEEGCGEVEDDDEDYVTAPMRSVTGIDVDETSRAPSVFYGADPVVERFRSVPDY